MASCVIHRQCLGDLTVLRVASDTNIKLGSDLILEHRQIKHAVNAEGVIAACGFVPIINNALDYWKVKNIARELNYAKDNMEVVRIGIEMQKWLFEQTTKGENKSSTIIIGYKKGIMHIGQNYVYISDRPFISIGSGRKTMDVLFNDMVKENELFDRENIIRVVRKSVEDENDIRNLLINYNEISV